MELRQVLFGYLILINIIGFIVMGLDKQLAIRQTRRIPEKILLIISAMGGSIGSWIAMQTFRHKTSKPKFMLGIPILFLLEYGALYYLMNASNFLN